MRIFFFPIANSKRKSSRLIKAFDEEKKKNTQIFKPNTLSDTLSPKRAFLFLFFQSIS